MAERVQEPESEAEETLEQASPAAVSIALGGTSRTGGKPVDAEAVAFLRDQRRLINLQRGLDLDIPDRAALNVFLARIGKGQAHG